MRLLGRLWSFWAWLKLLREDAVLLFYAWRHPLTPAYLKGLLAAILLYVISPIDIVPDYLPLVGIADDATLVTGAVLFLTNLLPATVIADCRRKSQQLERRLPYVLAGLAVLAAVWVVLIIMIFRKLFLS